MKRRSTFFVATMWALATAALPAAVFAQTALGGTPSSSSSQTTTTSSGTSNTNSASQTSSGAAAATTPSTTLQERIAKRKTDMKTKLDLATQKRLQAKCKGAQTVLTNMKTKSQTAQEKRTKAYQSILTSLNDTLTKLKNQNVDTTELNTVIVALDSKVKQFTTDQTTYQQSLDDAIAMDCATDPAGFKATLDSLRAQRQQVLKDAADIRALQPQIAKALTGLGVALANKAGSNAAQGGTE